MSPAKARGLLERALRSMERVVQNGTDVLTPHEAEALKAAVNLVVPIEGRLFKEEP